MPAIPPSSSPSTATSPSAPNDARARGECSPPPIPRRGSGGDGGTGRPSPTAVPTTSPQRSALSRSSAKPVRSEEHTSELQSRFDLVCRLLLEKKNKDVE